MTPKQDVAFLDFATKDPDLPEFDYDGMPCPKCKIETYTMYGLAGGGIGVYAVCDVHGVVAKTLDEEDEDHDRGSCQ